MAKLEKFERVVAILRERAAKAKTDHEASVVVGYTAAHALWVHENRTMKLAGQPRPSGLGVYWGPNGRPGFLLDVAREMAGELRQIIIAAVGKGKTLAQALLVAGLRLQRESQLNVPVEYGALRASAFTRVE